MLGIKEEMTDVNGKEIQILFMTLTAIRINLIQTQNAQVAIVVIHKLTLTNLAIRFFPLSFSLLSTLFGLGI